MQHEIWKPVIGFEGYYEISNTGKIKSIKREITVSTGKRTINEKILTTRINNWGYIDVRLSKGSVIKTKFIHILTAEAFIPNPLNKFEVNHKNGIKTDNSIQNLEWVTHSENMKHAYEMGLAKVNGRKVIDMYTGKEYSSIKTAAKSIKINYSTLRNMLYRNKKRTRWEYLDAA